MKFRNPLLPAVLYLLCLSGAGAQAQTLEQNFRNPAGMNRLEAMWFWQGPYFSKEGIRKDLEAMKEAGLGGTLILNLNANTDNNPWPQNTYRGAAYWDALRYAVETADRLGLSIGLNNGPGYTGTGGPWIPEEMGMRQLVWSRTTVAGGRMAELRLESPEPPPAPVFSKSARRPTLYDDLAVYAVPDKPQVKLEEIVDLSAKMDGSGVLRWEIPAGEWVVYRFGSYPTMAESHPIPDDLQGRTLEVDKLSREANAYHWKHVMEPLKTHLGAHFGRAFRNLHTDSYECGTSNWTPRFREEFIARKGYDPIPWMVSMGTPVLGYKDGQYNGGMMQGKPRGETFKIINSADETDRFEWDYCDVVGRLYNDNMEMAVGMMHDEGVAFSYEAYHGPFDTAEGMAVADYPMATFWTRTDFDFDAPEMNGHGHVANYLMAGARAAGRRLITAEAFTSMPMPSRWTESPAQLKHIADGAFCSGVNHLTLHQWVHQPFGDHIQPGMTNYWWGTHFSRHQTWFEPGKAFFSYINRCQALLQYGEQVVEGLWIGRAGEEGDQISAYDFLRNDIRVEEGETVLASGRRYAYLVLETDGVVLPEVAEKIETLLARGAAVVTDRYRQSPSRKDFPQCDERVRNVSARIWANKERLKLFSSVEEARGALALAEDLRVVEGHPEALRYVHRSGDGTDLYFLANRKGEAQRFVVSVGVCGRRPELWQAEDGSMAPAEAWSAHDGRTEVKVGLKGNQSIFLVFRDAVKSTPVAERTRYDGAEEEPKAVILFDAPWEVRFVPKTGGAFEVRLNGETDLAQADDPRMRYFSGTAVYTTTFKVKREWVKRVRKAVLELGAVHDIARVRINGSEPLNVWYPPFETEVGKYVKPGTNTLEIEVTNGWANRIIGDERIPADFIAGRSENPRLGAPVGVLPEWVVDPGVPRPSERRTFALWNYYNEASEPHPAGLVGPVKLIFY